MIFPMLFISLSPWMMILWCLGGLLTSIIMHYHCEMEYICVAEVALLPVYILFAPVVLPFVIMMWIFDNADKPVIGRQPQKTFGEN